MRSVLFFIIALSGFDVLAGGPGVSQMDREALDRAAARNQLAECSRRQCTEQEIQDALARATARPSQNGKTGNHRPSPGAGVSAEDKARLDEAAAAFEADLAERRRRSGQQ